MMMRLLPVLPVLALLAACSSQSDPVEGEPGADAKPATAELTRLDCGNIEVSELDIFSQDGAYPEQSKTLVDSCYLIRHGDTLMLWDAGLPGDLKGKEMTDGPFTVSLGATIADQLAELGIKPEDIDIVGVSHYHFDHTGQLADFPNAKLVLGRGDWDALRSGGADSGIDAKPYQPWLTGGGLSVQVSEDYDLFQDGSVTVLAMPGHTPGHIALKVKDQAGRTVMLSGDLAHFNENYESNGVPTFNTDPEETVRSLERFKAMAAEENAVVVIQHEEEDLGKVEPAQGMS